VRVDDELLRRRPAEVTVALPRVVQAAHLHIGGLGDLDPAVQDMLAG